MKGLIEAKNPEHIGLTVYLNGCDVSDRCKAANDRQFWALLYDVDGKGNIKFPPKVRKRWGWVRISES